MNLLQFLYSVYRIVLYLAVGAFAGMYLDSLTGVSTWSGVVGLLVGMLLVSGFFTFVELMWLVMLTFFKKQIEEDEVILRQSCIHKPVPDELKETN